MAQGQQQVIDGHRGPQQKGAPVARRAVTPVPEGTKVYKARGDRYVFQIASPDPVHDPKTGRKERPVSLTVRFKQGRAVVSNPEHQARLEASSDFGFGRDFWLESEEQKRALEDSAKILVGHLKAFDVSSLSAALRAEVVKSLGLEVKDFTPPAQAQS